MAALLLLCSMFAFAFVFHTVTRRTLTVPAHFDTQLAAFAATIDAVVPASEEAPAVRLPVRETTLIMTPAAEATLPQPIVATDSAPLLNAASFRTTPTPLAASITPAWLAQSPEEDAGAVTRALASTRSALRNAFKKTF